MNFLLKWAGILFAGVIVIALLVTLTSRSKPQKKTTTVNSTEKKNAATGKIISAATTTNESDEHTTVKGINWSYSEEEDKITFKKIYYAQVEAKEELDFKSPDNGGSIATFIIKQKSKDSTALLITVTKGKFMAANTVSGGQVTIRFDENSAQTYTVSGAADGNSHTVFINATATVLASVKNAKTMMVQADFFDNGSRIMEFNVARLNWHH